MTEAKTPAARKPAARKPQDRKPKAVEAAEPEAVTITVDGFSLIVDPETLDDFELLENVARVEDGDLSRLPQVLQRMFGAEQYAAVKEHLRNDAGRITTEAAATFFEEFGVAAAAQRASGE